MTNVLIVDDERNIRKAFTADVASAPDRYALVDSIPGAESALPLCAAGKIDLIIMDINTANYENGIEVSARIKQRWPQIKIIVTTSYTDLRTLEQAREAGVDSFWFKDYSDIELLEVMDITMAGGSWYPAEKPNVAIGNTTLAGLTARQLEILYLLPDCISNAAIAKQLYITEDTVKDHIRELLRKTGCRSKPQLISLATQSKLVIPKPKSLKPADE
ncbi:MAG: response regulator [Oscillospiraceae bacterium]